MNTKLNVVLAFFFLSVFQLSAQNGNIRGTVIDDATGEVLPGVRVLVEGLRTGAVSDIEGKFDISIAPGKYNLVVTAILFDTLRIMDVEVLPEQTKNLEVIKMGEPVMQVETITVSANKRTDTDLAVMTLKRKSPNMIDGISAASFRKIGDSDAASAMTRVPGVSLAGGKYVFVRGLGDRYNKTVVNGMDIPGLDPDRNTLQMDIFPTSIIENMVVNKSFVAELPADFTGGIIDINLKNFPDHKVTNISVSLGYNPNFHFNKDYLTYEGGKTDFLGFDDGTRDIPAENNIPFYAQIVGDPDGEKATRYKNILRNFNPTMAAMRQTSLMDYGLGFSLGNQKKLEKKQRTLGYNFMLSYSNSTEFYQEAEFGRYGLNADPTINEMEVRERQTGEYGLNNVMLSAMAGVGLKSLSSKITFNVLHLQNGESKAGIFDYRNEDQGAIFFGYQHNLEYSQRSLTNAQLMGEHRLGESKWSVEWKLSPSYSTIEDPDIRFTRYEDRTTYLQISTEAGFPERIWRELQETNLAGLANATREFKLFSRDAKVKFGGGHTYKERDFNIRTFMINVRNIDLTGDPNELFSEENLWPYNDDPTKGTTFETSFLPNNPNQFNSNINNSNGFVSAELNPLKKLKAIVGVRSEYYTQRYTGQDQLGINVLNNDVVMDELKLFPSLNLVLAMNEKQNLRFSYGKTIARPSFKEMSYAEIVDPLTGRTFIGGLFRDADDGAGIVYWDGDLVSTDIHNFDLRWEMYPTNSQTISVSAFYKKFINPIEIIQFATQAGAFQPRNVGDGQIIGGELELRLNLNGISEKLKNYSFVSNVTVTDSRIELSKTEYDSRVANAREGQTINTYRKMAGQAPFIINAGFSYNGGENGFSKGFEVGLYYNVQGQTLQYAGIVDRPDIYTVPFHSLNFNANKKFGKDQRMVVGLKIANILNDKKEEVFKSYNAEDQYFSRLTIGTTASVKFGFTF